MFFIRLKVIILSIIILVGMSIFLLYKVDLYIKNRSVDLLASQLSSITKTAFDIASITGLGVTSHTYEIINTAKKQKELKDLWISRSDILSEDLNKSKSTLRDALERKVYVTKTQERDINKIEGSNDHTARISIPIIANDNCIVCHINVKAGEIVGSVNAEYNLQDSIRTIYETMKLDFWAIIAVASLIFMFAMMMSISSATKIINRIRIALQGAINGDFKLRVKDTGLEISSEISKITNRLLETLDRNVSAIDVKISSLFVYNKSLYNKNPLIRLTELVSELANLFSFKNKLDSFRQVSEIYRELQITISKYIKYENLIFAEFINGEITSGYKVENGTEMKVSAGEIKNIEERFNKENLNVLFDDKKGCIFISTSIDSLNVIDLKVFVSDKIMLYYSILFGSKKELQEKEKSISRIYNYIRDAKPMINNVFLVKSIEESSYTDPLTKAYNRFYLEKYVHSVEDKVSKNINYGILMIDIDHFKRVNDTYGHTVGDMAIVLLVETIRNVIKASDKVIRYGGEEFVVILDNCDIEDTYKVAERLRSSFAMAKQSSLGTIDFKKSISIGISSMPEFSRNVWECINQADLALYDAKESGRNRVIKYSLDLKAKDDEKKAREEREEREKAKKDNDYTTTTILGNDDDDDDFLESLKLNNLI